MKGHGLPFLTSAAKFQPSPSTPAASSGFTFNTDTSCCEGTRQLRLFSQSLPRVVSQSSDVPHSKDIYSGPSSTSPTTTTSATGQRRPSPSWLHHIHRRDTTPVGAQGLTVCSLLLTNYVVIFLSFLDCTVQPLNINRGFSLRKKMCRKKGKE